MRHALRAATLYGLLLLLCWPLLRVDAPDERDALPLLPAEAAVQAVGPGRDLCGSESLLRSLGARSFRWVYRPGERAPLWSRGLTVLCEETSADAVTVSVLAQRRAVYRTSYRRGGGVDGDEAAARVIARLLPLEPRVAEAAIAAYLSNQADIARAGADLWRARRWKQASDVLFGALENDWEPAAQADLYFGLAESQAHLGRARQAFWYALAYLGSTDRQPPEAWARSLRGAAGVLAGMPVNVEPQAEALARRWRQAAEARRWDEALDALRSLCAAAPWAADYQDAVAELYRGLGWKPLADSWARRADFTRRLASDTALQGRAAELLR